MFKRGLLFGFNHPWFSFLLLLILTVPAVMGLPRLTMDTGFSRLISDTDPDKAEHERITRIFGSDNTTVVYIRDADFWTRDKLRVMRQLHRDLETLPFVKRVESLFTAKGIWIRNGRLEYRAVFPTIPDNPVRIADARESALRNPLLSGLLLAPEENAAALLVSVREDADDDQFDLKAHRALEEKIAPARKVFQEIFQVGASRINAELKRFLYQDLITLAPASALLLFLTITLFLGSLFAAIIPLLTALLSLVWTFGMMGWLDIPINILTVMLPSLVVVIGSTEDTFMLSAYLHNVAAEEGDPDKNRIRRKATRFMMKHMGVPLLLTTLTTAMGFASNSVSEIGMIRDFSHAAAFAILANGLATLFATPLILANFGPTRARALFHDREKRGLIPRLAVLFNHIVFNYPKTVLILTVLLVGFFLHQAASLRVTNDPISYFKKQQTLIRQTERIHDDLAGVKTFFVTLESAREGAFREPGNLMKLETVSNHLRQLGLFDRTLSLADFIALANREHHRGEAIHHRVPDDQKRIDRYLEFLKDLDLKSLVTADYRHANIIVRHNVHDSHTLNRTIKRLRFDLINLAGPGLRVRVVGENLMINAAAEQLMTGQLKSLSLLLAVIFVLMSIMFTSIKGGLVSLVPNLVPIIIIFGLMGLLDISINPGTAMLAVIAIGIAIDDTIHLFSQYNEVCRRTPNLEEAVRRTIFQEAIPVVSTTFSLMVGFSVLLLSNFSIIAQFGALAATTMLIALLSDLIITPIIMARVRLVGISQILGLKVQKEVLEKSLLFRDMTPYQVRKAILISELFEFVAGDLLVKQNSTGRNMALILSGTCEVTFHDRGEDRVVATLGPGEIFGEIGFIMETRRTADVRATSDMEVLVFNARKMQANMKYFPGIYAKLNLNISRVLGERLAEMTARAYKRLFENRLEPGERAEKPDENSREI